MARVPSIVFANLTCRFGDKYVLLDLASEIALPAFTDNSLRRNYSNTSYFFLNVGIVEIEIDGITDPQLTIYGRIVKDTVLIRSQIYLAESGLIPDEDSIQSSPSSFFALDLNNHKLVP